MIWASLQVQPRGVFGQFRIENRAGRLGGTHD